MGGRGKRYESWHLLLAFLSRLGVLERLPDARLKLGRNCKISEGRGGIVMEQCIACKRSDRAFSRGPGIIPLLH